MTTESDSHAGEDATGAVEKSVADESFAMRIENFAAGMGLDETTWPLLTWSDEFLHKSGTQSPTEAGCHLDFLASGYHHYGQFAPLSLGSLPETPLSPSGHILEGAQHADDPGAASLASQSLPFTSIHLPNSNTSMASNSAQHYLQRLSEFNTQLSRAAVDMSSADSPTQIEQAAAPVLKNSAIFLDLIKCLPGFCNMTRTEPTQEASRGLHFSNKSAKQTVTPGEEDEGDDGNGGDGTIPGSSQMCYFVPDMATVLQLVVFSMRLTELHHDLYLAIYRHLQQQQHSPRSNNATPSTSARRMTEPSLRLPVSLSIAGFSLIPNPRFQLHLLLQSAVHYLGSSKPALPYPLRLAHAYILFKSLCKPHHTHLEQAILLRHRCPAFPASLNRSLLKGELTQLCHSP